MPIRVFKRARSFCSLPAEERRLLAETAFVLALIRVGMWLLPFRTLWSLAARTTRARAMPQEADETDPQRVAWAVALTSRYMPAATCLVQALTAKILLARRGLPADLRVGVTKDETGRLQAHAWLVNDGQIVTGGLEDLPRYTPFPHLNPRRRGPDQFRESSPNGSG